MSGKTTTLRYHVYQEPAADHNQRTPEVIDKENAASKARWIDPAAHEVWGPGLTELEAYGELFGEALEDYNSRQKRKDRRLTVEDYRASVLADTRGRENKAIAAANKRAEEQGRPQDVRKAKGKHTSHEVVLSLGNVAPLRNERTGRVVLDAAGRRVLPNRLPDDVCRAVYMEYMETWQQRNPNFYLYRADYHRGEWYKVKSGGEDITTLGGPPGQWLEGIPHPHFTFIPWAEGYKKGLSRQVSTGKALAAMGFMDYQEPGPDGKTRTVTAWEQWQQREQEYIGELVAKYLPGYTIVKEGGRETSLSATEYQALQDLRQDAQEEAAAMIDQAYRTGGELIDKVLDDARAEAEQERQQLLQDAQAEADSIKAAARAEAGQLLQDAQRKLDGLTQTAYNQGFLEYLAGRSFKNGKTAEDYLDTWEREYRQEQRAKLEPERRPGKRAGKVKQQPTTQEQPKPAQQPKQQPTPQPSQQQRDTLEDLRQQIENFSWDINDIDQP